jgi:hypothetical protein
MKRVASLLVLLALAACGAVEQRKLSLEFLTSGQALDKPVIAAEYAPGEHAQAPGNRFSGRLRLDTSKKVDHFLLLLDEFGLIAPERASYDRLPGFDFAFVQVDDLLVPAEPGPVVNEHPWWEFVFQPGSVWDEPGDSGWTRAALPFALKEKREDCTHNGLMTFLFRDSGEVSAVAFQLTNQTCRYLQFDMSGVLAAEYFPGEIEGAGDMVSHVLENRSSRLPTLPIETLAQRFPGAESSAFGSVREIDPADMTLYGFVIDGAHYVGGCDTPYGKYPYCDDMALPSYSTAKSVVAGFGLMLLETGYPGAAGATIGSLVSECGESWNDVTIEHALDMTTGHFDSPDMHGDEDAALNSRFFAGDHAVKIDVACNGFPRRADPGSQLTYHTWDTYLAGTAMNAFLRAREGPQADFFADLLVRKVWRPLGLSPLAEQTRRTYDDVLQPYAGFGLTLLRDDVAKLARFIGPMDGRIAAADVLDRRLFDAVKQRIPEDPGMVAELGTIRYNNGFRSFDVSAYLGCAQPTWVVVLSGFGGIIVAVMPNDTAYYYFSDGGEHRYLDAVRESHRIRPMCGGA